MTRTVAMRYATLPGSHAGIGHIGARAVIADRPRGIAGGEGLGWNGAELFAAALGGCFWNDLHYAAASRETDLAFVEVEAEVTLSGDPLLIAAASLRAWVRASDPQDARACFDSACASSTVASSVMAAFPVTFAFEDAP